MKHDILRRHILYTFSHLSLSFKQQFTNDLMLYFSIRERINYTKNVTFPLHYCFRRGQLNGLSLVPHYYYDHHVLFYFYINPLVDLTLWITLQIYQWQCRFHIFTAAIRRCWTMSMELLPTWKNINR